MSTPIFIKEPKSERSLYMKKIIISFIAVIFILIIIPLVIVELTQPGDGSGSETVTAVPEDPGASS